MSKFLLILCTLLAGGWLGKNHPSANNRIRLGIAVADTLPGVATSGDATPVRAVAPPDWPQQFGFGRPATPEHIARLDGDVRPDGLGLPPGSGTSAQGAIIFAAKCAACHGVGGTGGPNGALVVTPATSGKRAEKVIGNYWPYATTVFDYIKRAMPFNDPGSLTDDEVYALTAYLLAANKLLDEKTLGRNRSGEPTEPPSLQLNANTLPTVQMPARTLFIPDDRTGGPTIR